MEKFRRPATQRVKDVLKGGDEDGEQRHKIQSGSETDVADAEWGGDLLRPGLVGKRAQAANGLQKALESANVKSSFLLRRRPPVRRVPRQQCGLLYCPSNGTYYLENVATGKQTSLRTKVKSVPGAANRGVKW